MSIAYQALLNQANSQRPYATIRNYTAISNTAGQKLVVRISFTELVTRCRQTSGSSGVFAWSEYSPKNFDKEYVGTQKLQSFFKLRQKTEISFV